MHVDARTLEDGTVVEGDLCIVGAGAAGLAIALEWIDTPWRVILLEGGGFEYDADVQRLCAGGTSGQRYYPLMATRLHHFGGTTGHWGGMCAPLDPHELEERPWVPGSGWPITRPELDPFYRRALPLVEIGDHPWDLPYWRDRDPERQPLPLDPSVVENRMWQFSPFSRFNELYRDRIVAASNVHLVTWANAVEIDTSEDARGVRAVTATNHAGRTVRAEARHFILACGAIQNARLLLASNRRTPAGLGNDRDQVGRHFMEHLEVAGGDLWMARPHPMRLYSWTPPRTPARAELAPTPSILGEHRILSGTVALTPLDTARYATPKMDLWQNEDPRESRDAFIRNTRAAADSARRTGDESVDLAFQLDVRMEQAPNRNSRVTLAGEVDALGVPRAHLHWALTALEKRSLRTICTILGHEFGRAGIGRVQLREWLRDPSDEAFPEIAAGWHHMGTTRMGTDPAISVVDADCRVHGIDNLYVAGSSCFTTAGAPNPTLTLLALSLRLSDHVRQRVRSS